MSAKQVVPVDKNQAVPVEDQVVVVGYSAEQVVAVEEQRVAFDE